MLTDADAAALYDRMYPWDPERWPSDAFYDELVLADRSASVLDLGCGTGQMLRLARELGHSGRLVGIDPDPARLERARCRADIEWIEGLAADADRFAGFDLVTMAGHAFQCLVTDEELLTSLAAVRRALRGGGLFAFETRHPQARAWESWTPAHATEVIGLSGRPLRVWHEVLSVTDGVITFAETVSDRDGTALRTDRTTLRFLDVAGLTAFLTEAGFEIAAQYGDWDRSPIDGTSREIITLAQRP